MSQFFLGSSNSNVPPHVATSYVEDSGSAVPSANILNILTNETNVNNDHGILSTGSGNTVTIYLTNRITGAVTTTDATPTNVVSVSLGATPGTYVVEGSLIAYDVTDAAGGAYTYVGAAVTNGITGVEINSEIRNIFEQAALTTADFSFSVSGNNALVTVTGIAGKTIDWSCLFVYRFVG